jgi:transcription initiation factor IIE alpha subunit
MSGLKGVCPKCGASYYGWALRNPGEPKCDRCGSDLKISENGAHIRSHYSSLTTRTYKITNPTHMRRNNN